MPTSSREPPFSSRSSSASRGIPGVAHYLIHLYDYPADSGERARGGQALCRDRPGGAACAAHALAHLHARGLLEGVDRIQPAVGARGQGGQGSARSAARHGLSWSMPICSSGRTKNARAVVDEMNAVAGVTQTSLAGPYALAASTGALHGRTRRLEGGGGAAGPADPVRPCRCDDAFRARFGGGPLGQSGRRQGGHRQARRAARQAARGQGRLLVGAGRHPAAGRDRLGALCRGQARTTRSRP